MAEKIIDAIKKLREKKRNFPQTFDLIINLKEYDLKKPENKFADEAKLPFGIGQDANVVVFSDNIEGNDFTVVSSADIAKFGQDKRSAKKLAKEMDFSLAEPKLMPLVGKSLGQMLAPRGKMPKLLASDVNSVVEGLKKSVKVRVKDAPVIQCKIGKESMKDDEIEGNIKALIKYLENKLSKGKANIGKVLLKLTMSEPIEVTVYG